MTPAIRNATAEQLQEAREYAARPARYMAENAMTYPEFADHITDKDRAQIAESRRQHAESVERGEHDRCLGIALAMHYYLTGEELPILP